MFQGPRGRGRRGVGIGLDARRSSGEVGLSGDDGIGVGAHYPEELVQVPLHEAEAVGIVRAPCVQAHRPRSSCGERTARHGEGKRLGAATRACNYSQTQG